MGAEVRFAVRLTPRRGPDRVDGVRDGVLLVRVGAAPVDGAANEALVRLLAAELGLPRAAVRLVGGATGRRKVVAAEGEGIGDAAQTRWPGLAVG